MLVNDAVRHNYLLRGMTPAQIERFTSLAKVQRFEGGDVILRQYDKTSALMIILDGEARIKSFSGETVAEVGPGSLIGEVSLVDDQPRSATVTAVGATEVAWFPSKGIRQLMNEDTEFRAILMTNVAKVLAQRLRTANIQLDSALPRGEVAIADLLG